MLAEPFLNVGFQENSSFSAGFNSGTSADHLLEAASVLSKLLPLPAVVVVIFQKL